MTTPGPPRRPHRDTDPLLLPARLPFPGSPPPGGWSTAPVAERLVQALERLVDLNERTARMTDRYRANLQQQQSAAARRSADARRGRDDDRHRGAADDGRELER
ncbi:hypothetical protein [Nakamurella endophytica]|uniref:Uncharacterized protein n=1 Tax=Nakamurella endophytica TaxID=1748367 RepID=A0A917T5F8_9ACTN|nr:hypothetical protein [Nakamurella endophytica]GGM09925.1 hypothetical protein GCM10011594_32270 [Nakamurella endophytica]